MEVDLSGLSGRKDVYWADDFGTTLAAQNYLFVSGKVYDGYVHPVGITQVDVFVVPVGAGPDADHLADKAVAATALCPTYYPTYNSHSIKPAPPASALPIDLTGSF